MSQGLKKSKSGLEAYESDPGSTEVFIGERRTAAACEGARDTHTSAQAKEGAWRQLVREEGAGA